MYQLPSSEYSPQFPGPRTSAVPRFGVLILIWILLAGGYGVYRVLTPRTTTPPSHTTEKEKPAAVNPYAFALSQTRATNASTATLRAETQLRQVETEIRHTLTLTDSFVEARHLHTALAKLEAAHQGLERARNDLDALQFILKGENNQ